MPAPRHPHSFQSKDIIKNFRSLVKFFHGKSNKKLQILRFIHKLAAPWYTQENPIGKEEFPMGDKDNFQKPDTAEDLRAAMEDPEVQAVNQALSRGF